jgi:putative DNA primase/helicase
MSILRRVQEYRSRGWQVIPIGYREKGCRQQNWPDLRIAAEDLPRYFHDGPQNIGVLLGEPSRWLVDVDLECAEAVALADEFLPPTDAVFGRPSRRRSHRLYVAQGAENVSFKFGDFGSIAELHSTRRQMVFPGSTHESGEPIEFESDGQAADVDAARLTRIVAALSSAVLIAANWPARGARDEAAMALAGMLLKGGVGEDEAERFVAVVTRAGGCDDVEAKVKKVSRTQRRLDANRPASGRSRLAALIGGDVVNAVVEWLQLKAEPAERNPSCTDAGNGDRLIASHGKELRYVFPWKTWFHWDGRRWARDDSGRLEALATATARGILYEAADVVGVQERQELTKWSHQSQSKQRLEAMMWAARHHVAAAPEAFDANHWLLNAQNGALDLRTGALRAHRREDLITRLSPIEFDEQAACPGWLSFLDQIMGGDSDMVRFLQHAVGYTLTGDTSEQCFFVMHGDGSNGKSQFIEVMRGILGDYGRPTEFRTLVHRKNNDGVRNDLAAMRGLRLVTAVESDQGQRFDEALVKQLTGNDKITARFLYGEFFDFHPTFKLWLAANHMPAVKGTDDAIWRRIRLIRFEVKFPPAKRIPNLGAKLLAAEGPGILRWALQGCIDWQSAGRLVSPSKVEIATDAYRRDQDVLGGFLEQECVTTATCDDPSANLIQDAASLYRAYASWCDKAGEEALSKKEFGLGLRARGFPSGNAYIANETKRAYRGIALRSDRETPF